MAQLAMADELFGRRAPKNIAPTLFAPTHVWRCHRRQLVPLLRTAKSQEFWASPQLAVRHIRNKLDVEIRRLKRLVHVRIVSVPPRESNVLVANDAVG